MTSNSAARSGYAPVNGLNLYYEIHGSREPRSDGLTFRQPPLVLLHGGLGGISMFEQLLPALSQTRPVIAVDLQAHGHTADIDRPLRFEGMADDVAGLLAQLGVVQADIFGYSLGGGAAFQTAIRYPGAVRKLVVVSAPCRRSGWYPEVLAGMAAMDAEAAQGMVGSPMHQAYVQAAPKPEDWPVLVARTGELLKREYDWSKDVAAIKAPTLIVVGDADSVRTSHAAELFELLGGGQADAGWDGSGIPNSRLAILPATTHYNIFYSPMLPPIITTFLDAPMPKAR